jgi:hypothetical protein
MLQAQLRGKLTRKEEDLEDLLTSNVFGSIKYVQRPEDGLLPILASCTDSYYKSPSYALQPISNINYDFWPWLQEPNCEGCEPDVIIHIQYVNNQKIIILVEAKYLSGKSSGANEGEAPTDQLAREWDNLTFLADREGAIPLLLYVTADLGYHACAKSIEDSCREYKRKRNKDMSVFWISWRKLRTLFLETDQEILKDLVKVLVRQGLTFFEGITKPKLLDIDWSFTALVNWDWSQFSERRIYWKYQVNKAYIWQYKIEPIEWRFGK